MTAPAGDYISPRQSNETVRFVEWERVISRVNSENSLQAEVLRDIMHGPPALTFKSPVRPPNHPREE
jgi:hypothetical protein